MNPCVPDVSVDKHVYHERQGSWVQSPWKAALVFPCRNCLFNDLTLHLKDVYSTSSWFLVSLMAQWIGMCTMSVKGCGFKPHGRLHWSFLAEKVSLMTSHLCSNVAEGSSYNSIVAFGLGKKAGLIYKTDKR